MPTYPPPTNNEEALALALTLAVVAPDETTHTDLLTTADQLAQHLDPAAIK